MDMPDSPAAVATPGGDSVGERSIRGGTLTVGIQLLSQAMTVVSVATLARLLTPQDYGSVAMVTALTGFLNLFREFGLSGATIQKPRISHDEVSSLFFINVGLGALITATTIASAPLVAWFYGKPHLIALTVGLSLGSLCKQPRHPARRLAESPDALWILSRSCNSPAWRRDSPQR